MGCPLEAFFLGLISTQLLWKGVIPLIVKGYDLNAPKQVLVEEGLCAMIPCNFTYVKTSSRPDEALDGFWKKGIEHYEAKIVANSKQMSAEDHFQLIGDLTAGNCSLLILNAQKSDTGNYFFRMEKNYGPNFSFFSYATPHLNVTERQPPEIQFLYPMREGSSTNITCATFASCSWMPPNLTWDGLPKHNDSHLQLTEAQVYISVVVFSPSAKDHKRNITCRVDYINETNSVPRETTVQLNVTFKPQIVIKVYNSCSNKNQKNFTNISQFEAQKGDCIRLRCKAKGNPSPRVTWVKETQVLNTPTQALKVLKLSDLKPENAGKYTCQAANELGSVEASLDLSVTDLNKTLVLAVTGAFIMLAVIVLITGSIFAYKRYLRKRKTATDSETGNTSVNVKKPSSSDLAAQEVYDVPFEPRSTHESVDGDPRDPEEIHYAILTFIARNPKPDITAEETQTDYAEIGFGNSQGKEV